MELGAATGEVLEGDVEETVAGGTPFEHFLRALADGAALGKQFFPLHSAFGLSHRLLRL